MRKSQALELATVPIRVSVYTRRQTMRHPRWLASRRPRSYHSDVLLYWPSHPRH
jgi:hypothetical protein